MNRPWAILDLRKTYKTPLQDALGPPTGSTRPPYSIHWTLLQGSPKAGALQLVYIYKEVVSRTVVREVLPRATTHRHQTFPDCGRHIRSQSKGATCAKRPLPRSARQKTSNRPSAILDLRRKYTVFRARSYAADTKEDPQPLFANSSCERRRNVPKRSQPWYAVPHINIRW